MAAKKQTAKSATEPTRRVAEVTRNTRETKITVSINLDGTGQADNQTGIGFFDHMLDQLARHSLIDIKVACTGDLHIDAHHSIEDVGWALGAALNEALGARAGINRFGNSFTPMDEALTRCSIDLSQRPFLVFRTRFTAPMLGTMATELVREFFQAFAQAGGITLHIHTLYGDNNHHIAESCFKAVARALKEAVRVAYIENYDMALARLIVPGVDIWLNTPKPPMEASGTSGMKAALNGVPNFSVLDGWWIEGHIEGITGWAIGPGPEQIDHDNSHADEDLEDMYDKLERIIIPLFYTDRAGWVRVMKNAIGKNAYYFNTHVMMRRYVTEAYIH